MEKEVFPELESDCLLIVFWTIGNGKLHVRYNKVYSL